MKNKGMPNLHNEEPYVGMPIDLSNMNDFEMVQNTRPSDNMDSSSNTDNCLDNYPIAMAYVPWQKWNRTYDLNTGIDVGTIFPELNLPLRGFGGGGKG